MNLIAVIIEAEEILELRIKENSVKEKSYGNEIKKLEK